MNKEDLADIERVLKLSLPDAYKSYMEGSPKMEVLFQTKEQILEANLRCRASAWDGEPLDQVFFIIGEDSDSREYMMDLDVPGELIMIAGNDDPGMRATVVGLGFESWIKSTQDKNPA
jgi:hypothetical protein